MYADRRSTGPGLDPRSAGIALAINGAVLAALIFAAPEVLSVHHEHPLTMYPVPITPPPEPLPPPKPAARAIPAPHPPVAPIPLVRSIPTIDPGPIAITPIPLTPSDGNGTATGTATATATATATPTPMPVPAFVGPQLDPRYARDLQPDYPAEETRAMREGRVVVRVLVGADGRVKQVERTSAASDAFWRATERQALAHWRFRPATRGGVPEEAWRTMAISFVLRE